MEVYRSLEDLPNGQRSVLTMGTFDGLHIGHRSIMSEVIRISHEKKLRSVVLTFDPHPREIVQKPESDRLYLLTSIEERLEVIEQLGIDVCLVLPFTRELSLLTAKQFFDTIIAGAAGASHVIVGDDHAFGKGRLGTVDELRKMAAKQSIDTTIIKKLDFGGQKISSSSIRRALHRGDVHTAAQQLGREYSMTGIVVKGDNIGHKMGFPTANIELNSPKKLIPLSGVYAVRVSYKGEEYLGMMNIGKKPTISNREKIWLEVHIFEFGKTIYGEYLTVRFVERLRDERKFRSRDDLIRQLHKDADTAKSILNAT